VPFQAIPRELAFYDLFEQAAANVEAGAQELLALVDDLPNAAGHGARIQELEHRGDDLTHTVMALLNTTFVVPIDRSDIHHLASFLDDVLDHIEAVGDLLVLHGLQEVIPQFRQQVVTLVTASGLVREAVRGLRHLRTVEHSVHQIKLQEREGDWVYRRAVAALYSGDYKAMDVLKWKDLLRETEDAIDRCEGIGNILESVALKFA
jgi:predicted phosphate transport protein (TIGR00153 family)